jgi:putative ABC transport system permease protein
MAIGNYLTIRHEMRTLSDVTALGGWSPIYRGPERTDVLRGSRVTAEFFRTVGVRAALGRVFAADDTLAGRPPVVILSEAAWHARFGGDSSVVGRSMTLDGVAHTIVGVVAERYTIPPLNDLWGLLPVTAKTANERYSTDYEVYGRLRPGVTVAEANADVRAIGGRLAVELPDLLRAAPFNAHALVDWNGKAKPALATFGIAVAFVLVIACINLAGLLLARLIAREREIAVRAALGAGSSRIARQLLTETLILSVTGGMLGLLTAWMVVRVTRAATTADMATGLPGWTQIDTDVHALVMALVLGAATGAVIGLGPAFRFSRPELVTALKDGVRAAGGRSSKLRRALVIAEIGFSVVLLSAAVLLARSTVNIYKADLGFRPDHVLTMRLRYPPERDTTQRRPSDFYDRLVREVARIPGVEHVGAAAFVPLSGYTSFGFNIEGRPRFTPSDQVTARMQAVTPGYFEAIGIPIRRGRTISDRDDAHAPRVAIVNELLSQQYFIEKGEDPIGRAVILDGVRYEIIGVAGNVHHSGVGIMTEQLRPEIFYPQQQWPRRDLSLAVRTRDDPALVTSAVTRTIRRIDPDIGVNRIQTMDESVAQMFGRSRIVAVLMGLFAAVAMVISAIGLYGLISYSVAQRTREFGIRLALGAGRRELLRLVVGDGVRLAAIGSVLGIGGALALMRLMRFMLYGIGPNDPATLLVVILTLGAITLGASFVPARRATNVDPMTSMRAE